MNILYHNKNFIVHQSPPVNPAIGDENTVQAALEGDKSVRALTTAATQRAVESDRDATIDQEGFGPTMLVRAESLKGNRTQLFALHADSVKEIYALSDYVEYICPYQAAIRAYVKHRFQETQTKLDERTGVAVVDIQGQNAFITVLDDDLIEIFRAVSAEDIAAEFGRTAAFYAHTHTDHQLFLLVNSQQAASALLSAAGNLLGPDVIPEPCPALWALHTLEVTPRFILPELEATKEARRERARSMLRLTISGASALAAAGFLLVSYLTYHSNLAIEAKETEISQQIKREIKAEAELKLPSFIKSLQPSWSEVITEIALSIPEGAKMEKMEINDPEIGLNTSARGKAYAVNIVVALEDTNPIAVSQASAALKEKLRQTRYLKNLKIQVAEGGEGKIFISLRGKIEIGKEHA